MDRLFDTRPSASHSPAKRRAWPGVVLTVLVGLGCSESSDEGMESTEAQTPTPSPGSSGTAAGTTPGGESAPLATNPAPSPGGSEGSPSATTPQPSSPSPSASTAPPEESAAPEPTAPPPTTEPEEAGGAGGGTPDPEETDVGAGGEGGGSSMETAEGGAGGGSQEEPGGVLDDGSMSFFVTSVGGPDGGNLGGLEGADAFCAELAANVSAELGAKPWRAYLSTSAVDARDRIGTGPWRNANGDVIANDVTELHDQDDGALDATWPPADLSIALTELGEEVVNQDHDILTGSLVDGTWDEARDCQGWTSNSSEDEVSVGHSNRDGGGRPPYFNATHQSGCAPAESNYQSGTVSSGGGRGSIYCFVPIEG